MRPVLATSYRSGGPFARARWSRAVTALSAYVALGVTVLPSSGAAAEPATQRYGIVASGGISLGSYQAGVTYAFLKYLARRREQDPHTVLEVSTGASAGNINALLAALTWLDARPGELRATRNLLWSSWIDVGWDRLSPEDPSPEAYCRLFERSLASSPAKREHQCDLGIGEDSSTVMGAADGLITRQAFRPAEHGLQAAMAAGDFRPGASVKVGVTLTIDKPQPLELGPITPMTQRVAVPMRLDASCQGEKRCSVSAFNVGELKETAGLTISLPVDCSSPQAMRPRPIPPRTILDTVEASSAFPLAFAPINIHYAPAKKNDACDVDPVVETRRRFADGGWFDNVPLGLAMDLADSSRAVTYLYVHPDLLRGEPASAQYSRHVQGSAYLARVAGQYVVEARNFELQGLARYRASELGHVNPAGPRAPDLGLPGLVTSNRFYPIMGEYLGSFGAFMNVRYRVHDYVIGLYDGVYTLAERAVTSVPGTAPDPDALELAFQRIAEEVIHNGEVAPAAPGEDGKHGRLELLPLLRFLFQQELAMSGARPAASPRPTPEQDASWKAHPVWRLHRLLLRHDARRRELAVHGSREEADDATRRATSFEAFLVSIQEGNEDLLPETDTPPVAKRHALWATQRASGANDAVWLGPEEWSHSFADRLLRRASSIERSDEEMLKQREKKLPEAERKKLRAAAGSDARVERVLGWGLAATRLGLASATERSSELLDLDPSTARRLDRGVLGWSLGALLPYWFEKDFGACPAQLGKDLFIRWFDTGFITTGRAAFQWDGCRMFAGEPNPRARLGVGIGYDPRGRLVDDVQLVMSWWSRGDREGEEPSWGPELSVDIATKFRIGIGVRRLFLPGRSDLPPSHDRFSNRLATWHVTLGVVDLPGLLYTGLDYFIGFGSGDAKPPKKEEVSR